MKKLKHILSKLWAWIVTRLRRARTRIVTLLQKARRTVVTRFQKTGSWIIAHKVRFFLIAGIIAATVILLLDYLFLNASNKADVIVEAHGMLFDIILFGIILTVYESYLDRKHKKEQVEKDKQNRIARYKEELEDYKGWTGEEAAFRVAGIVKRLIKEGVENIDLSNLHVGQLVQIGGEKARELIAKALRDKKRFCSLQGVALNRANLQEAYLAFVDLRGVDFGHANLQEANLIGAELQGANLYDADLRGAYLSYVKLQGARLGRANLQGAQAYYSQKKAFSEIMTEKQLNSMIWLDEHGKEQSKEEKPKCTAIAKSTGKRCKHNKYEDLQICYGHWQVQLRAEQKKKEAEKKEKEK